MHVRVSVYKSWIRLLLFSLIAFRLFAVNRLEVPSSKVISLSEIYEVDYHSSYFFFVLCVRSFHHRPNDQEDDGQEYPAWNRNDEQPMICHIDEIRQWNGQKSERQAENTEVEEDFFDVSLSRYLRSENIIFPFRVFFFR